LGLVPLKLYYNDQLHDNFTTATADGIRDAEAAGYQFIRVEGWIFTIQIQDRDLIPLKLYYNDQLHDNFTTATADGIRAAEAARYRFVRDEAYIVHGG
jgi:hypothetical protein